jgi:hypothetical protein
MDKESAREQSIARKLIFDAEREFNKNKTKDEIASFIYIPKDHELSSWILWMAMERGMTYKLYDKDKILIMDRRNVKK